MAFFQLVLQARRAEKARRNYEDEKIRSIEISRGAKPHYTLGQRLRIKRLRCKRRVGNFWRKITSCPENSWFHKKAVAMRTDGTFENYVAKSLLGFFAGVFLTYMFFVFFVLQLHFALSSATLLCTVIGMILTVGLAFSLRVRCIVFLLLPQFFSKRGRQALIAYVLILVLTGPVKNILHNVGVLSESLTCGQEQLKEAVKMVVDLIKQPFYALREAIARVIKGVKMVVKNIKRTLLAIKRLVLSILRVIKSVFQWLGSIVNMCNKKLGTPFDRCQRVFEGAVADCKAKLGPVLGGVCNLTYVVGALCYIVKPLDFICMLVSFIADTVVDAVKRKIKRFTAHMKAMFYVKIKFSHSFHFETNQSKTLGEVSKGILGEIRARSDRILEVFDLMSALTTLFIFFMLLRVLHYRYKWLTSERFDNLYVTEDLRTIDLRRARQDKETVLPLNHREQRKYTSLTSCGLIKAEKLKLARSVVFLGITTFKIIVFICIDYCLYWILSTIQYHGQFETKVQDPNVVTLHVSGDGYLAQLYRSIVKAFTPDSKEMEINTMPCLPDPLKPNYDRYAQILFLLFLCWIAVVFEPYGLRIRQVVMCRYYPNRAKQRAAWLYNHIIRSRGSFLKFARRQLRRKFGMTDPGTVEAVTLKERLVATCPFLHLCFPDPRKMCLLCGAVERSSENPHIKCSTPGCVGLYCIACYADLHNLCTICKQPVEYGDLSDISEEMDSSDDATRSIKWRTKMLPARAPADDWQSFTKEVSEPKETLDMEGAKGVAFEGGAASGERVVTAIKGMDIVQEKYKEIDDDARDSETSYSYSYQDASSPETEYDKEGIKRIPFKDVEAQTPRDDVTIQVFNEPSEDEIDSNSLPGAHGFLEADPGTKQGAKLKRKLCSSCQCRIHSDSSESWSEELDEQEVEGTDSSEESLLKDSSDKRKEGRIKSIAQAVSRIPCFHGNEDSEDDSSDEEIREHSFVQRIVRIFQRKQSQQQPYTKLHKRRHKETSSSSESSDSDDLKNNVDSKGCQEKIFATKQFSRYSGPVPEVAYYEINETSGRECECINALSDTMTSGDSRKLSSWNIVGDDDGTRASAMMMHHCRERGDCVSGSLVSGRNDDAHFGNTSSSLLDMERVSEYGDSCERRRDVYPDNYFASVRVFQEQCECRRSISYQGLDRPGRSIMHHSLSHRNVSSRSLPGNQHPELMDELMDHDMVREIRQREAGARVESTTSRTQEESSARSTDRSEEINLSWSASSKIVVAESVLPYQQTEAYKNVVSELRRRAILRGDERPEESTATIPFAGRTDKQMHSLHGPEDSDVSPFTDSTNTLVSEDFHHPLPECTCHLFPCEHRPLESSSSDATTDTIKQTPT